MPYLSKDFARTDAEHGNLILNVGAIERIAATDIAGMRKSWLRFFSIPVARSEVPRSEVPCSLEIEICEQAAFHEVAPAEYYP